MPEATTSVLPRDATWHITRFVEDVRGGRPWFDALLDTIAGWDIPNEVSEVREYEYLIEGEAFDWLLLAERIVDEAPPGILPEQEVEALLQHEEPPEAIDESSFQRRLGPPKYRAHLNFVYGVHVEEALQLSVELQLIKEHGTVRFAHDPRKSEDDVFNRIYGADRLALLREFRTEAGRPQLDRMTISERKAFSYWCFKKRLKVQDPSRVASDTRRGLLMLQHLEGLKRRRRPSTTAIVIEHPEELIDTIAVPVR